jgi:hypothetical protein
VILNTSVVSNFFVEKNNKVSKLYIYPIYILKQMALLISPILVSVGWIYSKPLTLDFNVLEISVLGCAVLIVNYLVAVRIIIFIL